MSEKRMTWHKIAEHVDEIEFGENNIAMSEVNGKKICIAKFRDGLFAFAHKCPHAGGLLADGYIDVVGNVVCPVHRYKYDLRNGRNASGEGYYLKNWPLQTGPGGIYIGMEEGSAFWKLF